MNKLLTHRVLIIYLFVSVIMISNSCNLTYNVRNQHNDIKCILYMPCGKVTIELIGRGNSKFVFRQKFNLDENIIVFADSLKIYLNEKQIAVNHNLKNEQNNHDGLEIKDNKLWEASFQLEEGVFEGDTISVVGPSYVLCKDQVISLDSMVYSFRNSLQIYGINDY